MTAEIGSGVYEDIITGFPNMRDNVTGDCCDASGRTTSVATSAGTTTLTYDYESRVTGITYPGSSTNSFTYNGLDTRVGKVDSAGTSTYKRDGAYVTDPVLADGAAAFTPSISERRSSTTTYFHSGLKNNDRQSNTS